MSEEPPHGSAPGRVPSQLFAPAPAATRTRCRLSTFLSLEAVKVRCTGSSLGALLPGAALLVLVLAAQQQRGAAADITARRQRVAADTSDSAESSAIVPNLQPPQRGSLSTTGRAHRRRRTGRMAAVVPTLPSFEYQLPSLMLPRHVRNQGSKPLLIRLRAADAAPPRARGRAGRCGPSRAGRGMTYQNSVTARHATTVGRRGHPRYFAGPPSPSPQPLAMHWRRAAAAGRGRAYKTAAPSPVHAHTPRSCLECKLWPHTLFGLGWLGGHWLARGLC